MTRNGGTPSIETSTEIKPAPLVSVIVPVYKAEAFLADCFDSLLGQSLKAIEIIAVNDASPDGSQRIIEDYAARDSRLRYIVNATNEAGLESRIRGAELAHGHYLIFCDADDRMPHNAVEILYETARSTNADIVHGRTRELRDSAAGKRLYNYDPFVAVTGRAFVNSLLGAVRGWNLWGKLYSRKAWNRALGFLPRGKKWSLAEDLYAVFIIGLHSDIYAETRETVYWYRQPDMSYFADSDNVKRRIKDHVEVLALMRETTATTNFAKSVSARVDFLTKHIVASILRNLPPEEGLRQFAAAVVESRLGEKFLVRSADAKKNSYNQFSRGLINATTFLREYGVRETGIALRRSLAVARKRGWQVILSIICDAR